MLSLLGYETNITLSSANGIGCLEPGGTDSSRPASYIAQQTLAAHLVKSSSPGYIFHFICRERLQYTRQWIGGLVIRRLTSFHGLLRLSRFPFSLRTQEAAANKGSLPLSGREPDSSQESE